MRFRRVLCDWYLCSYDVSSCVQDRFCSHNWAHHLCRLKDLGLEKFSVPALFTRIFIPTSFLLVCILHLHYFHERFLELTDIKSVADKQKSTISRYSRAPLNRKMCVDVRLSATAAVSLFFFTELLKLTLEIGSWQPFSSPALRSQLDWDLEEMTNVASKAFLWRWKPLRHVWGHRVADKQIFSQVTDSIRFSSRISIILPPTCFTTGILLYLLLFYCFIITIYSWEFNDLIRSKLVFV